jgi:hypothetical protein
LPITLMIFSSSGLPSRLLPEAFSNSTTSQPCRTSCSRWMVRS